MPGPVYEPEYSSTGDQSQSHAAWSDWKSDHTSPQYYGASMAIPGYGMYRAIKGFDRWNSNKNAIERRNRWIQDQQDKAGRHNAVGKYGFNLDQLQGEEDFNRSNSIGNLDRAFQDPAHNAAIERSYSAELGNALTGIDQQYGDQARRMRLRMAKRGVIGGSSDIEGQTRLGAEKQGAQMSATQGALRRRTDLRNSSNDQYNNLRRALLAGDPQKEAQFTQLGVQNQNAVERMSRINDFMRARAGVRAEGADINSRLVGNLGYAGASYVDNNYGGGY